MIDFKSFLLGKNLSGSSGSASKEVDILDEQEITAEYVADFGMAMHQHENCLGLKEGETYFVNYDGVKYELVCKMVDGSCFIGNSAFAMSENTGEPFCIADIVDANMWQLMTYDTETTTHTIRIYQSIHATDLFPQAKTVELEMAEGNQTIAPDEGYLLSQVTVNKPATLIPENIAEGIDIGGVIGSLVAGGGNVKVASGTLSANTGAMTVTHGLGVVPDLIVVGNVNSGTSYPYILNLWGMSKALGTLYGYASSYKIHGAIKSSSSGLSLVCYGSDITTTGSVHLSNANDTTFTVGVSGLRIIDGTRWLAIGGLTE